MKINSPNRKRVIKYCGRCKCPGHQRTRCPVFKPKYDNYLGYNEEINRIQKMKMTPVSNTTYMKNWIKKNGGSRYNIDIIYNFIKTQEIFNEDNEIIHNFNKKNI